MNFKMSDENGYTDLPYIQVLNVFFSFCYKIGITDSEKKGLTLH